MEVTIPVWIAGVPPECEMTRVFASDRTSWTKEKKRYKVVNGELALSLGPKSALVLSAHGKPKFAQKPRWW